MAIAPLVLSAFVAAQTLTDGPVPTIRDAGWDFPGLAALYADYDPGKNAGGFDGGNKWRVDAEGSVLFANSVWLGSRDRGAAFWVTTVVMKGGAAHISDRTVVPQDVIAYARPNEKPYCYFVVAVPMNDAGPIAASQEYALYDHDADGSFEELDEVHRGALDIRSWVPRPRLGTTDGKTTQEPILAVSEKGWRVPAGLGAYSVLPLAEKGWEKAADAFSSSRLLEAWEVPLNGMKARAEWIQTGHDTGWSLSVWRTGRGVHVSHGLARTGPFVTRYYDPNGKIFCLVLTMNPWTGFGIIGGLYQMAFYDFDGNGTFEANTGVRHEPRKDWIPRAPKSMTARR